MRNLEYVYQGMFSPPEVHENGRCIAVVTSSDKDAKLFAMAPEMFELIKRVMKIAQDHEDFNILGFQPFWDIIERVEEK